MRKITKKETEESNKSKMLVRLEKNGMKYKHRAKHAEQIHNLEKKNPLNTDQ